MSTWDAVDNGRDDTDGTVHPDMGAHELLATLTLDEVAEAAGELHRRIGIALRDLGELRADRVGSPPDAPEPGASARTLVARLLVAHELAADSIARQMAGDDAARRDAASSVPASLVAALSYAAPTIPALLTRLEQDRRLLVALGRRLENTGADDPARALLRATLIEASARCAQALEARADAEDA